MRSTPPRVSIRPHYVKSTAKAQIQPPTDGIPGLPWMTWIPDRLPEFKVHTSVGLAKSALSATGHTPDYLDAEAHVWVPTVRGGVLYQLVDNAWTVSAVVQPGTLRQDHLMFRKSRKWNKAPGITTIISEHPYEE